MDVRNPRELFLFHISQAKESFNNDKFQLAIVHHQVALNSYGEIIAPTSSEKITAANAYHSIANCYFNLLNFSEAASFYLSACNQLVAVGNLTETHWRLLTKYYINLSDAYCHLSDIVNATQANKCALEAFSHIPLDRRTEKEKLIGDEKENIAKFRKHFEELLSEEKYRNSCEFNNNQQILSNQYHIESATDVFSALNLEEPNNPQLSVQTSQFQNYETNINNDESFRKFGNECLNLATTKTENSTEQLLTYKQALQAFCCITTKNTNDQVVINELQKVIENINTLWKLQHLETEMSRVTTQISTMRFFSMNSQNDVSNDINNAQNNRPDFRPIK